MTVLLLSYHGLCRRRVLLLDLLEFFFEFIGAHIIHAPQFVDVSQRELGLAEISQSWLGVVLRYVLIGFWRALVQFIEDHADI